MSDQVSQPTSEAPDASPAPEATESTEATGVETQESVSDSETSQEESISSAAHTPEAKPKSDAETMSESEAQKAAEKIEKQIQKMKVKIDGQEQEVDVDELVRNYQKGNSANKRFQQAAKMKKEAEQLINTIKQAPAEVLKKLGVDVKQFAEDIILKDIELEKMDPKDREIKELKDQLDQEKKLKKQQEDEREQEEYARLKAEYEAEIEEQITTALETSELPKTPYTVKRMIQYLNRAVELGHDDITPQEVIKFVQEDYDHDIKSLLGRYNADVLLQKLPPEILDKIREADMAKVKKVEDPLKTQSQSVESANKPKESKKIPKAVWRAWTEGVQAGSSDPIEKYMEKYEKGLLD